MGGVSIDQWRGNIGIFHRKKIAGKCLAQRYQSDSFSTEYICILVNHLSKPIEFLFNLLLLFSYCSMIVILFPICLMIHNSIIFLFNFDVYSHKFQSYSYLLQPLDIFIRIHLLPKVIFLIVTNLYSYFKKLFKPNKNILFFIFVLQMLLLLSGTLELNPGPMREKKSNLSFAVWNLDSLPARQYARVPVIESFQASYDFDLFGVCESSLNRDIPNESIFIDGFSRDPFRADKPLNIRNGGVCLTLKKTYQLRNDVILTLCLKL